MIEQYGKMKMNDTNKNDNRNDACGAHVCPHTFSFVLDNWPRRIFLNPNRLVKEYIEEGDTVIDLGCGPGFFSISMARNLQRPVALGALLLLLLPLAAELFHTHRHEAGTDRVLLHGAVDSDQTAPCDGTHLHRGSSPPSGHCTICLLHRVGGAEPVGTIAVQEGCALAGTIPVPDETADFRPSRRVPPSRAPPSA